MTIVFCLLNLYTLQLIMGLLKKYFVQKAASGHLGFLPFSTKRDMHLLKYKLFGLHKSIYYLNAFQNKVNWETSG